MRFMNSPRRSLATAAEVEMETRQWPISPGEILLPEMKREKLAPERMATNMAACKFDLGVYGDCGLAMVNASGMLIQRVSHAFLPAPQNLVRLRFDR
jgi:hypothetical protein